MGKIVAKYLNTFGYTVFQKGAPGEAARHYIRHHLKNFPFFMVTPDVFSGPVFGHRLSAVFVFKPMGEFPSTWVLEGLLSREECTTSYSIFPKTEQGILNMVGHYRDLSFMMPLRV